MTLYAVDKLIAEARRIAAEYRRTTGKSLGISSEIAKHDACVLLGLEPCDNCGGYDAIDKRDEKEIKIQIKGRTIFNEAKSGQRIGQLKLEQDWDEVVLVLMDENFETFEIHKADRKAIDEALEEALRSNRKSRGIMSISRFRQIARLVWASDQPAGTRPAESR